MSALGLWIAEKGLEITASELLSALKEFEGKVPGQLETINHKLDAIMHAPYRQALLYYKEGKYDKCEDKLKEAISLDDLNLPAFFLHIVVLIQLGQLDHAASYSWELLDRYGFRYDLVPERLFMAYRDWFFRTQKPVKYFTLEIEDNYYPEKIWCSPNALAVQWKKKGVLFSSRLARSYLWNGMEHLNARCNSLRFMTAKYVILDIKNRLKVFDALGGRLLREVTTREFDLIFHFDGFDNGLIKKCQSLSGSIDFKGMKLVRRDYDYLDEWEEEVYSPGIDIGDIPHWSTVKRKKRRKGGKLYMD